MRVPSWESASTRALIDCIPREGMAEGALTGIPGTVPSVARYPSGCRYHPRCPSAGPVCQDITPLMQPSGEGGHVACHFPQEPAHG